MSNELVYLDLAGNPLDVGFFIVYAATWGRSSGDCATSNRHPACLITTGTILSGDIKIRVEQVSTIRDPKAPTASGLVGGQSRDHCHAFVIRPIPSATPSATAQAVAYT